jgi:hypothetical protein
MMEPELFDVVELLVDLPESSLRSGTRGAIVDCHRDGTYEVEFTNEEGETVALCSLSVEQFIVVWRTKTQTWLPITEQIASLITHLPEDARQEVLHFARFLYYERRQGRHPKSVLDPERISKQA